MPGERKVNRIFQYRLVPPPHEDGWRTAIYVVIAAAELFGLVGFIDGFFSNGGRLEKGGYVWSLSSILCSVLLCGSFLLFTFLFTQWEKKKGTRLAGIFLAGVPVVIFMYSVWLDNFA